MKIFFIITICFMILVTGCSKAPLPTDLESHSNLESDTMGKLIVTAIEENGQNIDSAEVHLNGEFIGLTPLDYITSQQGVSAIRVQKERYMIFQQSITTQNNETVYIEAVLHKIPANTGQLLVTVDQDSCEIRVSDSESNVIHQELGREVAMILPSAGYFIKAVKHGFEPINRATKVREDSITIENLHLIPIEQIGNPQIQLYVPDSAEVNQPVLVQWESSTATHVNIDYIDNPGLTGKREITFSSPGDRVISATAYNQSRSVTVADTIVIYEKSTPSQASPALEFEVTPKALYTGKPVQLRWRTDGKFVIIDQGVGTRGPEGNEEVTFSTPGTKVFTAIAYGDNGLTTMVKDSVEVKPAEASLLPTIKIEVSDSVERGQPVLIEWHAWNATVVDVDYIGPVGLNGKAEISFESSGMRIITATAYNLAGQTTAQDTAIIYEPPMPFVPPIQVACGAVVAAHHACVPQVVENAAEVMIDVAGMYRVIAEVDYNSGDEQQNESFFIIIQNVDGAFQLPSDPNAGPYKVVTDDPGPAHIAQRDAGIFYFSEGNNQFQVHHYASIAEQYSQFAVNPPIKGAESVRVVSFRLEYMVTP